MSHKTCTARVWDNGDMTDCGKEVQRAERCSFHVQQEVSLLTKTIQEHEEGIRVARARLAELRDKLLDGISRAFRVIEENDLRVGAIWLNPREVSALETSARAHYDKVNDPRVRRSHMATVGAPFEGMIFGAKVFSSGVVVPGHIAILPDGFEARLVDSSACFSLGLERVDQPFANR
jgi:hypothetical protein